MARNRRKNNTSQNKDYKITYNKNDKDIEDKPSILTAEQKKAIEDGWMSQALQHFDKGASQYSVYFTDSTSSSTSDMTIDDLQDYATNAQSNLTNITSINSLVRQAINEDDIIGKISEALESNLNANVRISYDALPEDYDEEIKKQTDDIIKRFHEEVNINEVNTIAITSVFYEGTCIQYLRSNEHNGVTHYTIDKYPLGVAIVSDYTENTIPRILIDVTELKSRLQKTMLRNKKNQPIFFKDTNEEVKSNYPKEVVDAYSSNERYALLDLQRTGCNRFGNLNRKYGLSPIFKALKPKIMLDTLDKADVTNAKAKAKKIIVQVLRKETMGQTYEKKGFEEMAFAHQQLYSAWGNNTVLYTAPPCVEKVMYVEPTVELTSESEKNYYRSRITSALGISFLNTDGQQTISTANISIKQLMKIINKIAERQEKILKRWYGVILSEYEIPMEYCPTPKILDAELMEMEMRQDLAEFLYSKLNASYQTAYEVLGRNFEDEMERRKSEQEKGYDMVFLPHATSYNSSGNEDLTTTENDSTDSNDAGRPDGSLNEDSDGADEKKSEQNQNYRDSQS